MDILGINHESRPTLGITDALFTFSRPVSGGYYWCPPLANGRLDLSIFKR